MKRFFKLGSLIAGGALSVLTAQAADAAATAIQSVEVNTTKNGMELLLATKDGDTPQIFAVNRDNVLQADITNAQLALPRSKDFTKENLPPAIKSIQLQALNDNTVRLTIKGADKAPVADLQKLDGQGLLVSLDTRPDAVSQPSPLPEKLETVTDATLLPTHLAQAETDTPDILVPSPEVIIDGNPVSAPTVNAAPPFLPRAVAPPVGDIAVSEVNAGLDVIDLGTAERVPRLVLRDATAREALSLLARAAGLNLAFTDASGEGGDAAAADTKVTLDIEDEPVQNVFNYVLQISGLEANRVGRTIFVGPRLPQSARNVTIRSVRLNQVNVATAINFLVFMGAESAFTDQQEITEVVATTDVGEVEEVERTELETNVEVLRADYQDSAPLLRGLEVIGDERTSSVTLVGTPRQIEIATAQLVQLDLRRRQVAVNVRVIDVDLGAIEEVDTSLSFRAGDVGVNIVDGVANFGIRSLANIASSFILDVDAQIQNGNAKIITDPTLIVQEGQDAAISLVEQVVSSVTVNFTETAGVTRETQTVNFEDVGLNLAINIDRIDDNGFVNLSVAPTVSSPLSQIDLDNAGAFATPITTRALSSGLIRVRDGQTLLLSGIIQETDRVTVTKVPILGDLPLIGALFRDTRNEDERRELIVLLTPQIMDDSDESIYGYSYTPGEDVRELLGEEE
ncbi:AMIN domain-containing protein [Leptothoe kymatousa]|uniref:AMIN domain-containing protein n=1 Tax=Leptothoe kymatousa TAU-MAC 1615 TaxID=2364775 RepID=A0ABS5Y075_9CYAN|nr:AMIN domain-containing protein [Leptothoe kymatousa]MBT9311238.1 AMIN domain-containing protein [Leptothoe kymatousa TAU-MAC 1615]